MHTNHSLRPIICITCETDTLLQTVRDFTTRTHLDLAQMALSIVDCGKNSTLWTTEPCSKDNALVNNIQPYHHTISRPYLAPGRKPCRRNKPQPRALAAACSGSSPAPSSNGTPWQRLTRYSTHADRFDSSTARRAFFETWWRLYDACGDIQN